jgi:transposase
MFSLTAQVAVRCIAKVADAYKLVTSSRRTVRCSMSNPLHEQRRLVLPVQRRSQATISATFPSISCGHSEPADLNAARSIWARASVTALPQPKEKPTIGCRKEVLQ